MIESSEIKDKNLYMCKTNEKLLTFYYSQDTEMPAVLLKGPSKKFDVESVAFEDR